MKRLLSVAVLCLLPGLGRAQVVVHQAALDQLAGLAPPAPYVAPPPAPYVAPPPARHVARHVVVRRHAPAVSAVAFAKPPPLPDLTLHAPPPVMPVVARPAMPPAAAATAPAKLSPAVTRPAPAVASGTVALHFAAGSAVLPAGMAATLQPICSAAEPSGTVNIVATAPGAAGDPSAAMRLSMQRAFAVRDALAACGISPARIIPRAIGAVGGTDLDTAHISVGVSPP